MTLSALRPYDVSDGMINEYSTVVEMRTGKGNHSTQRKPATVPLCPQKSDIKHGFQQ
jgi:hypothetical protein